MPQAELSASESHSGSAPEAVESTREEEPAEEGSLKKLVSGDPPCLALGVHPDPWVPAGPLGPQKELLLPGMATQTRFSSWGVSPPALSGCAAPTAVCPRSALPPSLARRCARVQTCARGLVRVSY